MQSYHIVAWLAALSVAVNGQTHPSVTIPNGIITGVEDAENNVQRFLGIPYAQPPVGKLRLQHAVPLNVSFGTLYANSFGPACYGEGNPNPSEDCLTLNIWRPINTSVKADKLPVLVWFYGGGLIQGYSANPLFEGTNLVRIATEIEKPVILVSLVSSIYLPGTILFLTNLWNYRLGPLGFLNGKQMADLGLLNLGMMDQRLALHWIQENIEAFGGDPGKVTLAGESAGAVSIYSHMMAYGGRDDGLFRGAILQSGGAFPLTGPETFTFQETFDSLISATTCASTVSNESASAQLDCIRDLPISAFLDSAGSSTGQSIDGSFTQTSIQFALSAGKYIKVSTIVGANTDEGTTSAPTGINTTQELWDPLSEGYFRPKTLPNSTVETLLHLYPSNPRQGCPYNTGETKLTSGTLDKKACSIFGDIVQIAPARMIAQQLAKHNGKEAPVYRYRFDQLPRNTSSLAKGITTGLEQSYVFSNLVPDFAWDQALAREMTSAWVSFAYSLDPNHGQDTMLPHWPQYRDWAQSIVLNGYGSVIEADDYRGDGISYIINNVLPYGAH